MGYKKLSIKKIENFFPTTVDGIPPKQTNSNKSNQPTYNFRIRLTAQSYQFHHGFFDFHRCYQAAQEPQGFPPPTAYPEHHWS